MVEHNKKYTFKFKNRKIIIPQSAHESEFHPFAKALTFSLYHKKYPTLRVEAKIEQSRYQPDLSAIGYDGSMLFWAECGKVSIDKVEKLFKKYRQAHFVFIKEAKDVSMFKEQLNRRFRKAKGLPLVDIIVYPEHFHDWYVSDEGDVFVPQDFVEVIRFNQPS